MDFHYELLEETRKEIKGMRFFKEGVEVIEEVFLRVCLRHTNLDDDHADVIMAK
ncbi:MAG: hypothetical protein K2O91_12590 [Lachnospiraceae bacterium]|nr:hypothetical protein [Lachnospiraceae bacterium]